MARRYENSQNELIPPEKTKHDFHWSTGIWEAGPAIDETGSIGSRLAQSTSSEYAVHRAEGGQMVSDFRLRLLETLPITLNYIAQVSRLRRSSADEQSNSYCD